jgi:hypothetical protein
MRKAVELAAAPDVEAEARSALARFRQGRRLVGEGKLPDTGEVFAWRLLSGAEEDAAVSNAVKRLADLGVPTELRAYADLEEALTWEVLALAMRDPEPASAPDGTLLPQPFAKDSLELRDFLSVTEREILAADYGDFAESVDPDPMDIEPAVLVAIDDAVKKKQAGNLTAFGSRALASYLLIMDNPPSTSPTGKSENGS